MAAKLNIKLPLPDKAKLKIMGAKFNAWWNGSEYLELGPDEAPPEANEGAANDTAAPEADATNLQVGEGENNSQETTPPDKKPVERPIVNANSAIYGAASLWGAGRLTPSSVDFDLCLVKELNLSKNSKFGFFCAEAGAQVSNIIKSANCKTEGYFIEAAVKDASIAYIKEAGLEKLYSAKTYDGTPKSVRKNRYDQVLMVYLSGTKAETESNIFALSRMLKPKGLASWVNFIAREGEERLEESSGTERRQFLTHEDILPAFGASGLVVLSEEECGADLLNAYYQRQSYIVDNWEQIQGQLMQKGGIGAVQAALDLTLAWRARIEALKSGKLHLRKFILKHG